MPIRRSLTLLLMLSLTPLGARAEEDHAARALSAFNKAEYETALKEYELAARGRNPAPPEIQIQIARSLDRLLRSNDAIIAYTQFLHVGASRPEAKEAKSRIALLTKHLAQGANAETRARYALERGTAWYKSEMYAEARAEFEGAVALLPDKPNAYRWLGLTDEKLGMHKQAIANFDTFLSMVPEDDPRVAEVNEARARSEQKLQAAAAPKATTPTAAEKAQAADKPGKAVAEKAAPGGAKPDREALVKQQIDRGTELFLAGKYKEAHDAFANARTVAPEKATPFRWLGLVAERMGHCTMAIENLDVFISKVDADDPRVKEAREVIAACREKLAAVKANAPPAAVAAPPPKAVVAAPPPKAAPPPAPAPPPESDETKAGKLIEKGMALYQQGKLKEARPEFEAARKLLPDRAGAYRWLALVDAKTGRCADAIKSFDTFLARVPQEDERVPEAKRERERCRVELAPKGTLVVTSTPPGAEVRLDADEGAALGITPWTQVTEVLGMHVVKVSKAGHISATKRIEVRANQTTRVALALERTPPPPPPVVMAPPPKAAPPPPAKAAAPPPPPAKAAPPPKAEAMPPPKSEPPPPAKAAAPPPAKTTPPPVAKAAPAPEQQPVKVASSEKTPAGSDANRPRPESQPPPPREPIEPATEPAPVESPPSRPRLNIVIPIAVGGAAVVLTAIGGGLVASSISQFNDLKTTCAPRCAASDVDPILPKYYAGYALIGVGVAAAAADVALWVLWMRGRRESASSVWIAPQLDGTLGAVVGGRF